MCLATPYFQQSPPKYFPQSLNKLKEQDPLTYPAPLVYNQQIYTPLENPNKQNPLKETPQKKQTVKDPLSILTLQKKQTHLHIIHKSQKDMNSPQHPQKYNKLKKNLSNIILTLLQLTTYLQSFKYFHQIHLNS